MCGILVCHKSFGADFIEAATNIISKRGADCINSIEFDGYVFLHSRLIITGDSDNGYQPFETPTSIFLFNGEIYNYKYLNELLSKPFSGNYSDSQVIHACIMEFGPDVIDSFDGPFAIIYYDKVHKKINAYRDHIGEKPLFHFESKSGEIYSSDLKVFKILEEASTISESSLLEYLSKGYIPYLNTIFNNVYKIRPWRTKKNKYFSDYTSYVDKGYGTSLSSRFSCIADQISFQNAALLLSGGVDSTLLACFLSKSNIHLYTTKFDNDKNDESKLACLTAKHLELPITVIELLHNIDEKQFSNLINSLNEPVGDPGIINQFHSLNKIREDGRKVVFVGTGGDEVFFGYPRYRFLPLKMLLDLLPSILLNIIRRFLSAVRMNDLSKNRINKFFSENSAIFTPEFDLKNYLPNQLFSAFDSLSFNNGIEARTPFTSILLLDHAVTSNNVRWFDFLILKLKLKILLYKKFGINKFFNQKKGFTNEYTKLGIDEKKINFNLFANYDQVQVAAKKSNLHLFRVFVLSRWLEC